MTVMEPRPAATVILLRDGADGDVEVLMLRKNPRSEFASGAYVFPGGAVEESDGVLSTRTDVYLGPADADASAILSLESGGIAYYAAAVREVFEESGVLIAVDPSFDHAPINVAEDRDLAARLDEARASLIAGETDLVTFVEQEASVVLALGELTYMSHWITPVGPPRRYDTRFFIARAPADQIALHEGGETVDTIWISPSGAIDAGTRNEIEIMFPTMRHLEMISEFKSVDDALAWAGDREVAVVEPRVVSDAGGIRVLLPGDEGYEGEGE